MTKEQYFDMCEMLQTEPIDSEIPIEISDLPYEAQIAYSIYITLNDSWESMSGAYLGKQLQGINDVMDIMEVEDKKSTLEHIQLFDACRKEYISKQQQIKQNQKTAAKEDKS